MGKITEFDKDGMVSSLLNYYNVMCTVEERTVEIAKEFKQIDDNWTAVETWFEDVDDTYTVCVSLVENGNTEPTRVFKCPVAWLYADKFTGPFYNKIVCGEEF